MGDWNLKEFKALCIKSGLYKLLSYSESLAFKYLAAKYHKGIIQQKLNEIALDVSLEKLLASDFEIAFELDSLMLTLNSMWDILGQLLNECFIHEDVGKVKFDTISKDCSNLLPIEIKSTLCNIRGDHLYTTIKEYVNVSKHRYAIKGETEVSFRETNRKISYITQEFEYKQGQKQRLTPNKAFKCLEFVGKSVDQVGFEIHKEVKLGHVT